MKNNLLNKFMKRFWPKPKSRIQIIESKVQEITKELLISGFSNYEIALISKTVCSDIKNALEDRKQLLINQLNETVEAINKL